MSLETQIAVAVEGAAQRAFDALAVRLERLEKLAVQRQPHKLLFTEVEAAEALSLSPAALKTLRCRGLVQAYSRAKPILYRWQDIEAVAEFLASRGGDE